jgi:hypothetical protein
MDFARSLMNAAILGFFMV